MWKAPVPHLVVRGAVVPAVCDGQGRSDMVMVSVRVGSFPGGTTELKVINISPG